MNSTPTPTPAHHWLLSLAALAWNLREALISTLVNVRLGGAVEALPAALVQMIDETPSSVVAASVLGVWLGLAGTLALLLRRRIAVPALALSLLGITVLAGYQAGVGVPGALRIDPPIVAALLLGYAWHARRAGILR